MPKNKKTQRRRNKRKEWRKLSDGTQEHSIQKTTEQIEGGSISSRSNAHLFTVDKRIVQLSKKEKKLEARKRQLRINKATEASPHIQPFKTPTPSEKRSKGQKRKTGSENPGALETAQRNIKKRKVESQEEKTSKTHIHPFDIWDVDLYKQQAAEKVRKRGTWEDEIIPTVELKKPKASPTSLLPSVELPDAGLSYNPDKALIQKAVKEQRRKKAEMKRIFRDLNPGKPSPTKEESDSQETESAEVSEEEETEKVNLDHIPRKSTAERNKEARKKEEVRLNRRKKEEKDLLDSITKLEETKKQIDAMEEKRKERMEQRKRRKEEKMHKPQRLGPEVYRASDIEVVPTSDLPSALRSVNPATFNLMEDRFKSIQRRNVVETRTLKPYHRRYKQKAQTMYRMRDYDREQEEKYKALGAL